MKNLTVKVKRLDRDDSNRQLYKNVITGRLYCDVNDVKSHGKLGTFSGELCTMSNDGEPINSLRDDVEIVILPDNYENTMQAANDKVAHSWLQTIRFYKKEGWSMESILAYCLSNSTHTQLFFENEVLPHL